MPILTVSDVDFESFARISRNSVSTICHSRSSQRHSFQQLKITITDEMEARTYEVGESLPMNFQ
jgi:hypothetical protein